MHSFFLCGDKDIYVFMPELTLEKFQGFVSDLQEELGEALQAHMQLYENIVDWDVLEQEAVRKYAQAKKIAAQEQETEQKKCMEEVTQQTMQAMDVELLQSLAARREARTTPLVLVADDDQITRTLFRNVIGHDYQSAAAANGINALREYVAHAPDALFLDIGMPDIDGYQVLEIIFQIDPLAYVIMFSGRRGKENILKALQMGAQGFVGKPFTRASLLSYLEKCPFVQGKISAAAAARQQG